MPSRLHHPVRTLGDLVLRAAALTPSAPAIEYRSQALDYGTLADACLAVAHGLRTHHLRDDDRVAIYLPKRFETVLSFFGTALARGVFVPVNPLLKPAQVAHILRDSQAGFLVTNEDRACLLAHLLLDCPDLRHLVLIEGSATGCEGLQNVLTWAELTLGSSSGAYRTRSVDADLAAILYTSGSTGRPKGVVLSHRNMVAGAESVAEYLANRTSDRLLAVLPFSFDYGFSQLSTAFLSGASVVLMDYLLPRDVIQTVAGAKITGLAAVPPLWIQLSRLPWPEAARHSLRYITSSGGAMPRATLDRLRSALPSTDVFLMYGLTEAFRSTYLPPSELDRRPDSIGRAIPNTEVLVLRDDGSACAPGEPGELVHRGALVGKGYWRDPQRTAERFRPLPLRQGGADLGEIAVFSGDLVRMDEEGYLYFIGRRDDMIKTSGYRVSPTEIEEVLYATGHVSEAAAFGVPHPVLGQAIVVAAVPVAEKTLDSEALLAACKRHLPGFMVPAHIAQHRALPRNPNGKIDRPRLAADFQDLFEAESP